MSDRIYNIILLMPDGTLKKIAVMLALESKLVAENDKLIGEHRINDAVADLLKDTPLGDIEYIMASLTSSDCGNDTYVTTSKNCDETYTAKRLAISGVSANSNDIDLVYAFNDVMIHGELLRSLFSVGKLNSLGIPPGNGKIPKSHGGSILAKLFNCKEMRKEFDKDDIVVGLSDVVKDDAADIPMASLDNSREPLTLEDGKSYFNKDGLRVTVCLLHPGFDKPFSGTYENGMHAGMFTDTGCADVNNIEDDLDLTSEASDRINDVIVLKNGDSYIDRYSNVVIVTLLDPDDAFPFVGKNEHGEETGRYTPIGGFNASGINDLWTEAPSSTISQASKITLEVGKTYLNGYGNQLIVTRNDTSTTYPFTGTDNDGNVCMLTVEGRFDKDLENKLDIVSEVIPSKLDELNSYPEGIKEPIKPELQEEPSPIS